MSQVDFHTPPRIGHTPGVLDGVRYLSGWRRRRADYPRARLDDDSERAGWDDADNAVLRQGRDIDWPDRANLSETGDNRDVAVIGVGE